MAPSIVKLGAAAAAYAAVVQAANSSAYELVDEYTADNFFDKFDFYVSDFATGEYDPTHGFVNYRNQADAESLGMISSTDGSVHIGPNTAGTFSASGTGRDSVRIMSKNAYNQGLLIAKFSHLPVQACGAWPAFWSYGSPWLSTGEIDYYEGWNVIGNNVAALHTNETIAGECTLTTTGVSANVTTTDCNDEAYDPSINQYVGTGCGVSDASGIWGSTTGGTFAMEWEDSYIKIWNWLPSAVPADITAGTPDPTSDAWGLPQLLVEQTNCDLTKGFANQQLVFNVDFCGDTAGNDVLWAQTCAAQTGYTAALGGCQAYVGAEGSAFSDTYFEIEGISFYTLGGDSSSIEFASGESAVSASASASASAISTSVVPQVTTTANAVQASTTSTIYGTSTSTDEAGGEVTVVVAISTTICPVTAAEASASELSATSTSVVPQVTTTADVVQASTTNTYVTSVIYVTKTGTAADGEATTAVYPVSTVTAGAQASETSENSAITASEAVVAGSSAVVPVDQEATTYSTAVALTTSTIFATSSSTIASCEAAATDCNVGDVTTVVIAVSTTICPVTAAEASESATSVAAGQAGETTSEIDAIPTTTPVVAGESVAQAATSVQATQSTSEIDAIMASSSTQVAAEQSTLSTTTSKTSKTSKSTMALTTSAPASTSSEDALMIDSTEAAPAVAQTTGAVATAELGSDSSYNFNGTSTVVSGVAAATGSAASLTTGAVSSTTGSSSPIVQANSGSKLEGSGFALVVFAVVMFAL